jgi:phage terminase large subunit-like protein
LEWRPKRAKWAIEFFSNLHHTHGEWVGKPFVLEPWQAFVIGSLFGWYRVDGTRRFRDGYVEIPRKNGKSSLAAGVALLLAFFDDEAAAEVYVAATKKDQAKIVWGQARDMVLRTPALRKRLSALVNIISVQATGQKLVPLGKDSDSMDGLNVHGGIMDELHAHPTGAVVDVVRTATVARRQPLMLYITTAGVARDTVCWTHHDYSVKVADGTLANDAWFGYIAAADPGDDWTADTTWRKANPNYGVSVKPEKLAEMCRKAQEIPAQQSAFRRLHLNEWLQADTRALAMTEWDRGGMDWTWDYFAGRSCVVGLDLSTRVDLTALVFVFPDDDGGISVWPYFFVPGDNLAARVNRDRVPVDVWVREGYVTATPGNITDYSFVYAKLLECAERVTVSAVAADPWNAAALSSRLLADGFPVVDVRQGMRFLSQPTKQFLALVNAGKVRHPRNPCLTWNAANLAVVTDAHENQMPDKAKSTGRIDGVAAIITALSRVLAAGEDTPGQSAYDDHRLLIL